MEREGPDVCALWQAQPVAPLGLSAAEIRAKAGTLRGTIDARNNREWVAAAFVGVFFGFLAITGDGLVERVGGGLTVVGTAYVAWYIRAHGRVAALPGEGLPCAAFYRRELVRQRDLLRGVWRWYLGPLVPGMAVLLIGGLVRSGFALGGLIAAVFVLVVFGGVGLINWLVARELTRQIDAIQLAEPPSAQDS